MRNFVKLMLSILLCEGAGILGAIFTTPAINTWYITLNKPFFNPPNFLFAPVWTILYLLMGISLYLVWQTKNAKKKDLKAKGIKIFFAQLILNSSWSVVFFGNQSPIGGLIIIILLWVLIFWTIRLFSSLNKTASYLLYPYLVWVSFASILNLSLALLNP